MRSNKNSSKIAESGRDREAIIGGKWEPSRGNDSYLQLNENKVTAISYRTSSSSNNSSSSSSSSTSSSSTAEDQSIESFSSSSSFGSKPNGFQVLNNGIDFES